LVAHRDQEKLDKKSKPTISHGATTKDDIIKPLSWRKIRGKKTATVYNRRVTRTTPTTRKKNIDYFVLNIIDYGVNSGLPCSGARRRALAQTIGNARGLDINSPLGAEAHTQDLRFCRHRQCDDPKQCSGARQQPRLRSWL
jgi:hypothetical protein